MSQKKGEPREEYLAKKRIVEKRRRLNFTPEQRARWNVMCSEWRAKNKDKVRWMQRRWRKENIEKARAANRKWEKANPDRVRNKWYLRKYGITVDHYERLMAFSDGCCWICGNKPSGRRLAVDHCHITGRVRGLLCFFCNRGLRWFKDTPSFLERAAQYLTKLTALEIIRRSDLPQ